MLNPIRFVGILSDLSRQWRQRRILTPDAALGRRGEDVAHRYLQGKGFAIVARNYRAANGEAEVDIIARDGSILVFVEVKARSTAAYGTPDRAIDRTKEKRINKAARSYVTRAQVPWGQVRFDTVAVVFTDPISITHVKDAFFHGRALPE